MIIRSSVHLRKAYSLKVIYFICDFHKQNTLRIYWLWIIFHFSGLSLRKAADRLSYCFFIKRNQVLIWNWIQKYTPQKISSKKKKVSEYVIDGTIIKVGSKYVWVWVATIEPKNKKSSG
jgi:transposase-like protein